MTCLDLVKALQSGKSIGRVTTEKNVQLQTVIDALTKAYQAAISKDLEQGLIAKAVADGDQGRIADRVLSLLSRQGLGGPTGMVRFPNGLNLFPGLRRGANPPAAPSTSPAVPRG
jgi:hypothetical protein